MRLLRTKSEPDRLLDAVEDSLAALSGGVNRNKLKVGLIAGGVAALTAASAAISSIRRRTEGKNS
ncbi:MAG TPA: hypothetical protein VFG93_04785 [Gaiellaceae bacterium]|nr:hypothetical protein [Gaiellaceae bacterium]